MYLMNFWDLTPNQRWVSSTILEKQKSNCCCSVWRVCETERSRRERRECVCVWVQRTWYGMKWNENAFPTCGERETGDGVWVCFQRIRAKWGYFSEISHSLKKNPFVRFHDFCCSDPFCMLVISCFSSFWAFFCM